MHRHQATRKVVDIVAKRIGHHAVVYPIDVVKRDIRICDSIHTHVDLLVRIVVNAQRVNLKGGFNVIRQRGMALRKFLR